MTKEMLRPQVSMTWMQPTRSLQSKTRLGHRYIRGCHWSHDFNITQFVCAA